MVLSQGSWTLRDFANRVFLSRYSKEAMAAALPSGILLLTLCMFFVGVLYYTNAFVAQYSGAGRLRRIGASLWQGLWLAVLCSLITCLFYPLAPVVFAVFDHAPEVQRLEIEYFRIAVWGQIPWYGMIVLGTFYSGRGRTVPIMIVNALAAGANIALDYLLILGPIGLPQYGIRGAAVAMVTGNVVGCVCYAVMIFRRDNEERYGVCSQWRVDAELMKRLVRFGSPQGVQFFLDVSAFTVFVLLVGRYGADALTASTLALNLNTFAFLPMIGLEVATSTLVGKYIGAGRPDLARQCVRRCFALTFGYMSTVALAFLIIPDVFVNIYGGPETLAEFESVRPIAVVLLRFVGFYCFFDSAYIVFSAAVKGAGDTAFAMRASVVSSVLFIAVLYLLSVQWRTSLYWPWTVFTLFVVVMGLVYGARYVQGKWEKMRVIEGTGG
ncbi:MAG: MATE family efflux transporter [Candidatus Sumerlaeia bacterium]